MGLGIAYPAAAQHTTPPLSDGRARITAEAEYVDLGESKLGGEVSASGAFTYSIPIDVPAGRENVQPKLALAYSSFAPNGVGGMGWSLVGIPVIMRVNTGDG